MSGPWTAGVDEAGRGPATARPQFEDIHQVLRAALGDEPVEAVASLRVEDIHQSLRVQVEDIHQSLRAPRRNGSNGTASAPIYSGAAT